MHALVLKPRAIAMVKKAYDWYEEQNPGLGEIFLTELDRCYKKLETQPAFYRKLKKNYRQMRLKQFPYVVVYELMKTKVVVFAVFHTSRNPKRKIDD